MNPQNYEAKSTNVVHKKEIYSSALVVTGPFYEVIKTNLAITFNVTFPSEPALFTQNPL